MPYAPADTSFFSRRGLVFVLIVLLHVGMFWALQSGLSHQLVEAVLGPIETRVIEEQKPQDEAPPPPPPKFEAPPPFVPPPEVAIDIPQEAAQTTAITQTTNTKPTYTAPVAAPAPAVPSTAPKMDPKHPMSKPEYPAASRREGEAGTVQLEIYVLETGKVGDVRVKKSSGFERLDEAAVKEAKRSWRFVPGTENGKPVAMWRVFAVTFDLKDA
jgi:protein TonB